MWSSIYIASSPTWREATLAGDIVISGANSQVIADSGLKGADLVAIGATVNIVAFLRDGRAGDQQHR